MLNRAKCKLCGDIIVSYHSSDYITCKCGEISLDGGEAMRCYANDLANVIRVDDNGNEIIPRVVRYLEEVIPINDGCINPGPHKLDRSHLLVMLDEMISSYEGLPEQGLRAYCTNSDLCAALILMRAILSSI